jgi:4-aminobutyrate aminotransferase-like enzyme
MVEFTSLVRVNRAILLLALLAASMPALAHDPTAAQCVRDGLVDQLVESPQFTDADLLATALSLKSGASPNILSPAVLEDLRAVVGAKTNAELMASLDKAVGTLHQRMGQDQFEEYVGTHALSAKQSLLQVEPTKSKPDDRDMARSWGWKLLPENDPAFKDPKYLASMLRETGATGQLFEEGGRSSEEIRANFDSAWNQIAPEGVEPIYFAQTGTDANNLLYGIAKDTVLARTEVEAHAAERKLTKLELALKRLDAEEPRSQDEAAHAVRRLQLEHDIENAKEELATRADLDLNDALASRAEILVFDGAYGGGGGRIGEVGFVQRNHSKDDLVITSPHTTMLNPKDPKEIARLEGLEKTALAQIEQKILKQNPPIGGLLLEPILGAKGVYFYRPEFLLKVRALCDQLRVPIFADEVLTGGGRTGKFFAYQNYPGFEPDFVTFGKGLQVAGVASVQRAASRPFSYPERSVTLGAHNESLLKATQVLNRIRQGKLMENATTSGSYLLQRLQKNWLAAFQVKLKNIPPGQQQQAVQEMRDNAPRGIGTLIFSREKPPCQVQSAMGRLMPPLTITRSQIDQLFLCK